MTRTTILFIFLFLLFPSAYSATVTILVLDPNGQPVEGLDVTGWRLLWRNPVIESVGKTDKTGQIKVVFDDDKGEPASLMLENEVPYNRAPQKKGYGIYRFLIQPEKYNWALSDMYYWNHPDLWHAIPPESIIFIHTYDSYVGINQEKSDEEPSNWNVGKVILLHPADELFWEVRLTNRQQRRVAVRDQFDDPIPELKMDVRLSHDWGFGGFPVTKVTTDREGYFTFESIGDFVYTFDHRKYFDYYSFNPDMRTGLLSTLIDRDNSTIRYKKASGNPITVIALDKETRQPIEGAAVTTVMDFGYPLMRQGGPIGHTDANGRFQSDKFQTEHVCEFGVYDERYEESAFLDIKKYQPNETYTFELVKKNESKKSNNR